MDLQTAVASVFRRLHITDDGAQDPAWTQQIIGALNDSQAELAVTCPWALLKARREIVWPASQPMAALPAGVAPADIRKVSWSDTESGETWALDSDLGTDDEYDTEVGSPERWKATSEEAATGVEVTPIQGVILIHPRPESGGTLIIDYRPQPAELVNDADELRLDATLVVLHAALDLAPSLNPAQGSVLAAKYTAYAQEKKAEEGSRRGFSMSPVRVR